MWNKLNYQNPNRKIKTKLVLDKQVFEKKEKKESHLIRRSRRVTSD